MGGIGPKLLLIINWLVSIFLFYELCHPLEKEDIRHTTDLLQICNVPYIQNIPNNLTNQMELYL